MQINVREITVQDIPAVVNYWLTSHDDFLVGMGVDLAKMPTKEVLEETLKTQIESDYPDKQAFTVIWEIDGKAAGHSNINQIEFGKNAHMHLHLWNETNRKKGMGTQLVKRSLPFYFHHFQLEALFCEPYALNPAPNKTLTKLGFEFIKTYETIPGSICFRQEVNQWRLSREQFDRLYTNL